MKIYVGITDMDWFQRLKAAGATEANFWNPGGTRLFKALEPGGLFLFKHHGPDGGKIGGCGFFVRSELLPIDLAWEAFGDENGCASFAEMSDRIRKYRMRNGSAEDSLPTIGCTILTQTVFFEKKDWIDSPADWSGPIVSGKTYDTADAIGAALYDQVMLRLRAAGRGDLVATPAENPVAARLAPGAGMFRLLVAESYNRRCAVTGLDAVPALVAAHIKPISDGGANIVPNGLFLRADLGALFSRGLLTVDANDLRVRVSPSVPRLSAGGTVYHPLDGHRIDIPTDSSLAPDRDLLAWHNQNVFVA